MPKSLFRPNLIAALALSLALTCAASVAAPPAPSSASSAVAAAPADAQDDIFDTPPISEDSAGTMPGHQIISSPAPVVPVLKVIREGTRFVERSGRIERTEGQTFFIFDAPELPRLALLPSRYLELLEETSAYGKRSVRFNISGQVSEYRGKNFLRLDVNPQPAPTPAAPVPVATASVSNSPVPTLPPRDRDLPPAATSRDIPALPQPEPARGERVEPAARPAAPSLASPTGAPTVLVREGKRIVEQDGRLVRSNDQSSFIFDSGDAPVLLLPNLKLALMEDLADYGRRPVRFRISGVMTEYHGRNYLFMTKMVVIPKFNEKL